MPPGQVEDEPDDLRLGHCQLDQPSTFVRLDAEVSAPAQQAQVTASHSTKARVRSRR